MNPPNNKSLAAYAEALAKELLSGKTFPGPDPVLRRKFAEADDRDPDADLKHAVAVMEVKQIVKQSDAAVLEREDDAKTRGKYRNVHGAGKYGGE